METFADRVARYRAAQETKRAEVIEGNLVWLRTLQARDTVEETIDSRQREVIREALLLGDARGIGFACDSCQTELAKVDNVEMSGPAYYLGCPGCGGIHRIVHADDVEAILLEEQVKP